MNTQPSKIRWGVLGCGGIARKFVVSARASASAEIRAAASQTPGKAAAFARSHEIEYSHDSYAALLQDPKIDAVYVANTHNFHHETVLEALQAGKAVLCEKPLAINARQAREMVALARARKLFLMEAMWTRFLPAVAQMRAWIAEGRIGEPRAVQANFGINRSFPPEHRMVNPNLAGGVLLDLGIYPLSMASMIAGGAAPQAIHSVSKMGPTGVDIEDAILLAYPNHLHAQLRCGIESDLPSAALVAGQGGTISLPSIFIAARSVELSTPTETITRHFPFPDLEGFRFEIDSVCQCLQIGLTESPIMPLDETIAIAATMDALRKQWGLAYKGE